MPEVFGDGRGDQTRDPVPAAVRRRGSASETCIGSAGGGLSWLNAGLQRLVVDPEDCGWQGVARLPLQSRVGADRRVGNHQQGLELWGAWVRREL